MECGKGVLDHPVLVGNQLVKGCGKKGFGPAQKIFAAEALLLADVRQVLDRQSVDLQLLHALSGRFGGHSRWIDDQSMCGKVRNCDGHPPFRSGVDRGLDF
jgi:hypothetical protein